MEKKLIKRSEEFSDLEKRVVLLELMVDLLLRGDEEELSKIPLILKDQRRQFGVENVLKRLTFSREKLKKEYNSFFDISDKYEPTTLPHTLFGFESAQEGKVMANCHELFEGYYSLGKIERLSFLGQEYNKIVVDKGDYLQEMLGVGIKTKYLKVKRTAKLKRINFARSRFDSLFIDFSSIRDMEGAFENASLSYIRRIEINAPEENINLVRAFAGSTIRGIDRLLVRGDTVDVTEMFKGTQFLEFLNISIQAEQIIGTDTMFDSSEFEPDFIVNDGKRLITK